MKRSEIIDIYRFYYNKNAAKLFQAANLPVEKCGNGCYLEDEEGKQYLDFCASYGIFGLGYGHPKVRAAIMTELSAQPCVPMGFKPQASSRLLNQLKSILPPEMTSVYLTVSGSEAIEVALRIANSIRPERRKIISLNNSYHGKTNGAMTVLGQPHLREPFGICDNETSFVPFNDLDALEKTIDKHTLAIIAEPILGGGYITLPTQGYLSKLRKLCDQYDVLLIIDEVQTGFGRTGKMFAIEHDAIVPDILVISKGATGGHVPFAMVALHKNIKLAFKLSPAYQSGLKEIDYFSFPIIAAAVSASIAVIKDENLTQKAYETGLYLLEGLKKIAKQYPQFVLQATGIGLMTGIKVQNGLIENAIWLQMLKRGVITGLSTNTHTSHPVLRFFPPLIVTGQEVDTALSVLEESLKELSRLPMPFWKVSNFIFRYQFYLPYQILRIGVNLLKNIPKF